MKAIDRELLKEVMLSKVPAKVHDINIKAYELGEKYALDALAEKTHHAS
jgi:2-oxoglutarate ferredoxin oxidoreductase subunit gamma